MVSDQTVKDMSDEFITQIKEYQTQIDEFWQRNLTEKRAIVYVNERLQRLFKKLSGKLNAEEVKRQERFQKLLGIVEDGMFVVKNIKNSKGELVPTNLINKKKYAEYKFLVEKRELEINSYLEQKGLTATIQTRRLR